VQEPLGSHYEAFGGPLFAWIWRCQLSVKKACKFPYDFMKQLEGFYELQSAFDKKARRKARSSRGPRKEPGGYDPYDPYDVYDPYDPYDILYDPYAPYVTGIPMVGRV